MFFSLNGIKTYTRWITVLHDLFYIDFSVHISDSCFCVSAPVSPHSPLLASCWMNDSLSVSLSVSVIDQTPAAAATSWKDKPSWKQQYLYWSSLWPTGRGSSGEWKSRSSHLLSWEPWSLWFVCVCLCVCVHMRACIDNLIDGKPLTVMTLM